MLYIQSKNRLACSLFLVHSCFSVPQNRGATSMVHCNNVMGRARMYQSTFRFPFSPSPSPKLLIHSEKLINHPAWLRGLVVSRFSVFPPLDSLGSVLAELFRSRRAEALQHYLLSLHFHCFHRLYGNPCKSRVQETRAFSAAIHMWGQISLAIAGLDRLINTREELWLWSISL